MCPRCASKSITQTYVHYIKMLDLNKAECNKCGWIGLVTDLVKNIKNYTDKEILDWLSNDCDGNFSCERLRDPFVDSSTYGDLNKWEIFTVPSQHVEGDSVREAFINAINKINRLNKGL